jgi:glycosyltransferase involved in cell wall biosynthesis
VGRRPLRIGIINEFFYPECGGGSGTDLSNLARGLRDSYDDVEIEVITSAHTYRHEATSLARYEEWDGIPILRLRTPRPQRRSVARRLAVNLIFTQAVLLKLLTRPRYDVVLVATSPPTLALAAAAYRRLTGTPYIYLILDLYPDLAVVLKVLRGDSLPARLFRHLQKCWLHASARTIVLGRCMQDYLVANYELPRRQVEVIPIGYDPRQVFPMDKASAFRAKNCLSGFVVLYAGNLGRHQDFDTLLDAAALLRQTETEITFVFVGDGAKREYLSRRITSEGMSNVMLLPFVPKEDLSDLLASADVSLVTLEPGAEGLGVPSKFYNILASGRPTVALVAPGSEVARVLAEADCGVRVDQGDPAALARALAYLSERPEDTQRMGMNARRVFMSHFTWSHMVERYHRTFTEIADVRVTAAAL